jgi:inner membrane protein
MPSIMTHGAVPILIGAALGPRQVSRRLLVTGAVAAMLADLDVLAFKFGIPYGDALGHRGGAHSIVFVLVLACVAGCLYRSLQTGLGKAFTFVGLSALSHPLLDMCTNGGLGVALLWPWSQQRYFMPFRPIAVSPIGAARFLSERGWAVFQSELGWVWLPAVVVALAVLMIRRVHRSP